MDLSSTDVQRTVRFRDGYQEKSKSLEGRFWYSENWDNRLFQRDIHNEIHATKGISSGCYLQGIELSEYKWDVINNGIVFGDQNGLGIMTPTACGISVSSSRTRMRLGFNAHPAM
ncbi:hypothetical protein F2Q69_00020307 [Brassica cretica]|uniref:Uncharacterized protein n=1 Tax=Brassica cretica TaxID=69181 RepID=A0A8S9Q5X3_BRACR|nr:hypothetical protein F2Q69_00020307 [Brassica cretica]